MSMVPPLAPPMAPPMAPPLAPPLGPPLLHPVPFELEVLALLKLNFFYFFLEIVFLYSFFLFFSMRIS
jgi:hypothetical protein